MADKYTPGLGDRVIFIPRIPYGRQSELAAIVTRVWDADTGDLEVVCFPCASELQHHRVLRQGDTVTKHCWRAAGDGDMIMLLFGEIDALRAEIEALKGKRKAA